MMVNNSSYNGFFIPANLSSGDSSFYTYCLITRPSFYIFIAIDINIILVVFPLCLFILYLGVRQWLQKRSAFLKEAGMSHSDCFTYHMVTMELMGVCGYLLNLAGICTGHLKKINIGDYFTCITWYGQVFFHILTCLERYVAVVHPIVYLRLKNKRGIRIRNLSICCAWLLSLVGMSLMMTTSFCYIVNFCILISSLMTIFFCSLSVLWVLIHPKPGERGEGRGRVDRTKQKAFYMIVTILGVLSVRFAWNFVWEITFLSGRRSDCVLMAICVWFNVPSCLVLPLLFLHRAGKLIGCGNDSQSEKERDLKSEKTSDSLN